MRRLWNWAREVAWFNVLAVVLLVAGIVVASFAISVSAWSTLAIVLVGGAIALGIIGTRE